MDPGYNGDLGSVVSGGLHRFLGNDWPGAVATASNPIWPLDYTTEASLCSRFASARNPPSFFQSVPPPYYMFPSMSYPFPQDFHDMYKPSTYGSSNQSCQELCSSPILVSGVDSQIMPCPVFTTGLPGSPPAPQSYGISLESNDEILSLGSQAMEILQAAMSMPCTSLHSPVDKDSVKEESHNSTTFSSFTSSNLAPSSPDSVPVPFDSTCSKTNIPTTMSIKESDDPDSSSNQESRAESVVTTAVNRKKHSLKRRKVQQKTVVCVTATGGTDKPTGECVPTDSWAWRKYGQKPIKGSPYPRGYYRCSSSKGCTARKQVERSRTDPSMLMITYTSDHNHALPTHRNALAGTTRRNSLEKRNPDSAAVPSDRLSADHNNPAISSIIDSPALHQNHAVSQATMPEERALRLDQEANFDVLNSDIIQDDDLFAQLEALSDCFVMFKSSPLRERSDEEAADGSHPVDPFNLFDWSSICSDHGINSLW